MIPQGDQSAESSVKNLVPKRIPRVPVHGVFLVFMGGALGTITRYLLTSHIPNKEGFPLAILLVNLLGAFLLGFLIELVSNLMRHSPRQTDLRLFLGTGFLGGFTTYSAFSLDVTLLLIGGRVLLALEYAALTVVCGLLATFLGMAIPHWFFGREISR